MRESIWERKEKRKRGNHGGGRGAQQNRGELEGERRAEEGPFIQKGSLLLIEKKKKSKRKASSRLLDAVSNPISVCSGSVARLPGTGSQRRRAWAATPLTSNLRPPGRAWEPGAEGRPNKAPQMFKFS
ncbi:Hypothetical predicted protein [Xyrichtys novacula]|uniref:Uncharacterized protein n=1 Tax=Xyrichtys novacula TaxID=13765 RepID=A0AAV1GUA6_XYRNO|nr:Hypothetical predicted protein [Xyrichtys novacula]